MTLNSKNYSREIFAVTFSYNFVFGFFIFVYLFIMVVLGPSWVFYRFYIR